jgi:hypothetical protein
VARATPESGRAPRACALIAVGDQPAADRLRPQIDRGWLAYPFRSSTQPAPRRPEAGPGPWPSGLPRPGAPVAPAASIRIAQNLNSGILPVGSISSIVSRFAAASRKWNGMKQFPGASRWDTRVASTIDPRREVTRTLASLIGEPISRRDSVLNPALSMCGSLSPARCCCGSASG